MPDNHPIRVLHPCLAEHVRRTENGVERAQIDLKKVLETSPFGPLGITFTGIDEHEITNNIYICAPRGMRTDDLKGLADKVSRCFDNRKTKQLVSQGRTKQLSQSA